MNTPMIVPLRRLAACALAAAALTAPLAPISLQASTDAAVPSAALAAPSAPAAAENALERCDPRPWRVAGEACLQPDPENGAIRVVRVVTLSPFAR